MYQALQSLAALENRFPTAVALKAREVLISSNAILRGEAHPDGGNCEVLHHE